MLACLRLTDNFALLVDYMMAWQVECKLVLLPMSALEVADKYELEDVLHRLYEVQVLELVVDCIQALVEEQWVWVCK